MSESNFLAPPGTSRLMQRALYVGVIFLVLSAIGWFVVPDEFYRAYLMAYLFWLGVVLGCLAIVMLQFLSGGDWGLVIRRILEAATRTMPLMAALFIPLLFGLHNLYPWTNPDTVRRSEALQHKQLYLNLPFFHGRLVFYFLVWLVLAFLLSKWSKEQDTTDDPGGLLRRLQVLSGPGIVLYGLTVTFAGVDWIMSLDPEWFSTIYGMLVMAGQGLAALSVVIAVAVVLAQHPPLDSVLKPKHFHDLGKLLLAFVIIWAYFGFSQLLIIWAGNLPEETPWYLRRLQGGYEWMGVALVVLQFALPFLMLLSHDLKRASKRLLIVAVVLIVMRFVDLFWLTAPEFSGHLHVSWLTFATPIGIGGVWLAYFLWELKGRPLLPLRDPYTEVMLERLAAEAE
ncbi:MAG TPA: hypothetical protein VJX67_06460 [Blastocatellia bacterium]|nr:hypothetical protein [Blastocatellia bacterium]